MGNARTALDQVAECAMLNGGLANLLHTRTMEGFDFADYERAKTALAQDWTLPCPPCARIPRRRPGDPRRPRRYLGIEISLPWAPMTLAQIIAFPSWNMAYHEGQINYIASMLGRLE